MTTKQVRDLRSGDIILLGKEARRVASLNFKPFRASPYRLRTTDLRGGTPRVDALLGIDRVIVEEVVVR